MQIDLFNSSDLLREKKRLAGYLTKRNLEIVNDVSEYASFTSKDVFTEEHVKSILANISRERKYNTVFGKTVDSHLEIEKIGVGNGCKRYTTVLTLEDSLDLILSRLSGCSYNKIFMRLQNYKLFSRAILNINYNLMSDLSFDNLLNLDDSLDNYLVRLSADSKDNSEFLKRFYAEVIKNAGDLIEYLAIALKETLKRKNIDIVYRSKGLCSYVFTSDIPINDILELEDGYSIKLNSYEMREYSKHVNKVVRVSNGDSW